MAWDDLIVDPTTNAGSSVRYFVNGTSPNRVLVIDYVNLRYLGGTVHKKPQGRSGYMKWTITLKWLLPILMIMVLPEQNIGDRKQYREPGP